VRLDGKTVLLTGATGGLGRAISGAIAERGATLVVSSRKGEELEALASSLPGEGHRTVVADLAVDVADRHVLIVDDIVDTGLTLGALKRMLEARRPRSVRTCVLLDKAGRRETDVTIDYLGFTIPNVFVVGYGLDYDGLYRNLPYVAALDAI